MSVKTIKARIQDMICDARYTMKSTWAKTRLAHLPDFKHDGLGMNAITRNTVGYTASGSRGKCLGWYEYVGKPTPAPEKQEDLSKLGTYERIYREEVKRTGISGVFSDHSGVNTLSEGEIKALIDIGIVRRLYFLLCSYSSL